MQCCSEADLAQRHGARKLMSRGGRHRTIAGHHIHAQRVVQRPEGWRIGTQLRPGKIRPGSGFFLLGEESGRGRTRGGLCDDEVGRREGEALLLQQLLLEALLLLALLFEAGGRGCARLGGEGLAQPAAAHFLRLGQADLVKRKMPGK